MTTDKLSTHEMIEIHELLRSEVTGYKKLKASIGMVKDDDLKQFMNNTLDAKRMSIEEMQKFVSTQGIVD